MQWFINTGFSPFEIISTLIFAALLIYPVYRILEKIGINGWFSVLVIIPFVSIVALWVLAFIRWPSDENDTTDESDEALEEEPKKVKKSQTNQSE